MVTEPCNYCLNEIGTKTLKRCANCKYVRFSIANDRFSFLLTPGASPQARILLCQFPQTRNSQIPPLKLLSLTRIDLQSKKCQQLHWKGFHKDDCSHNAGVHQKTEESPKEKARLKEMRYWVNAWTPAISYCLPLALDLANHKWGRHDTHAYVHFTTGSRLESLIQSRREDSSCSWKTLVWTEAINPIGLGNLPSLDVSA